MATRPYTPGLKAIKDFFEMTMDEMKAEYAALSVADKEELSTLAAEALNAKQ